VVNGVDMAMADEEEKRGLTRTMGVLFQSSALLGSMTLAENVSLPLKEHTDFPDETIEKIIQMKLGLVHLSGYEDYLPSELSGGMRKRAGIARAMALDPTILFFDELSAGLDPVTSAELDVMVRSINEGMGTTMVVVTHELESIFFLAHRVIMLDKDAKGIIAEGDPKVLKETSTDRRVSDFFNRRSPTLDRGAED
jgi:phospholipid/cholesterol/gamma-HCH transport system ATP-binding protein